MSHPIYRVSSVEVLSGYSLRIGFDDGTQQQIDLEPVLEGELFGPLRDRSLFEKVRVDPEVHTVVWPNGADFDPATLHDWPQHEEAMRSSAHRWALAANQPIQGSPATLRQAGHRIDLGTMTVHCCPR